MFRKKAHIALSSAIKIFLHNYRKREMLLLEKGIFPYLLQSKGYVLVIVLLVTSMLVSISTEFLITAQTNINYLQNVRDGARAQLIAWTGIELCKFLLEADRRGLAAGTFLQKADKNIDCYDDLWAFEFPELPIEGATLKIRIYDENAKINLSVLANEFVDRSQFYVITQRFFLNLGLPMDLADCILDWVDIDDQRSPFGAESPDYYLTLERPYRARNKELDSLNDLFLIRGITPLYFYGLGGGNFGKEENLVDDNMGKRKLHPLLLSDMSPEKAKALLEERERDVQHLELKIGKEKSRAFSDYFRAYGDRSDVYNEINRININTAPYRVLSALTDYMTDDVVSELIRRRIQQPFSSVNEVKELIRDETVLKNVLTVKSYIFKLESTAKVGHSTIKITGYYHRDDKRFYYISEE
ncbi:MAG: general secretion pathway protein GspK [Spirochaetes bacterium]|nr:general secretion pathway protein GspK [Spirochaetota bacterium]